MPDRLTQLQDTVNLQAEHFCNSIGILQQCSVPSKFPGFERIGIQHPTQTAQADYAQLFSTLISRCAKDIDTLIESLPNEDSSHELQTQSLRRLEMENQEAAKNLEEVVERGQKILEKIQDALSDIAQAQLEMQYSTPSDVPSSDTSTDTPSTSASSTTTAAASTTTTAPIPPPTPSTSK